MDGKVCPSCSKHYETLISSSRIKRRSPLGLQCGHSMCLPCFVASILREDMVKCPLCHKTTHNATVDDLVLNEHKLHQMFPVNQTSAVQINVEYKEYTQEPQPRNIGICVECSTHTYVVCNVCDVSLCISCFKKTHKFVTFRKHELINNDLFIQPATCSTHGDIQLFYCKDCKNSKCLHCVLCLQGDHNPCKYHQVVPLHVQNGHYLKELTSLSPKVEETINKLKQTAAEIRHLIYNGSRVKSNVANMISKSAEVDEHFGNLISSIKTQQKEVQKNICQLFTKTNNLMQAKSEIDASIKKTEIAWKKIRLAIDGRSHLVNLPGLLNEAKEVLKTPWCLKGVDTNEDTFKITVNVDVLSSITDYVRLEGEFKNTKYMLSSVPEASMIAETPQEPRPSLFCSAPKRPRLFVPPTPRVVRVPAQRTVQQ